MTPNELIAEFMGDCIVPLRENSDKATSVRFHNKFFDTWKDCQLFCDGINASDKEPEKFIPMHKDLVMKYDVSWDWLMPVVEKIEENEEIDVNILLNGTIIFKWKTKEDIVNNVADISFVKKIEHTYSAVVGYIEWLNKQ